MSREAGKAEALHLGRLLKKRDQDRKVWSMFEKPWVSGLASKTWPEE